MSEQAEETEVKTRQKSAAKEAAHRMGRAADNLIKARNRAQHFAEKASAAKSTLDAAQREVNEATTAFNAINKG